MAVTLEDIRHHRTFTTVPLQSAEVEFVLQTRGIDHVNQVIDGLTHAGYKVHLPDRTPGNP
ncbi:MAG: hypothetical protein V2A69_10075 [Pseudomonadota bacterium]